jgi:acetoin utilization deacetylase AcuC-like enzyme
MLQAPLNLFFCDRLEFPLPAGHKFPIQKYRMLRERLAVDQRLSLSPAPSAAEQDLLRVHGHDYVAGFLAGTLESATMRRIGFPWSKHLVERTLASVGGTMAATEQALRLGIGGTLAGGTHHASHCEGSGFCVFNDLAIASEWCRSERRISRIAIIDLDVHQGDGTASIFAGDPGIFTLSLHGAHNFPFRKQRSRLDIELADKTAGPEYHAILENALAEVYRFRPEIILYQSGVDTLSCDRLGRLCLTLDDLARRDRLVLQSAAEKGIPVVITLGGGYSEPIDVTVEAHAQTFRIAASIYYR